MAENFFRATGELSLEIPELPRMELPDIQARWPEFRAIEYDESPVKPVNLVLGTFLQSGETWIDGKEYGLRRKPVLSSLLGPQHALWLQEEVYAGRLPELVALLREVYLGFPGMVVVGEGGDRRFAYLRGYGARVVLRWFWVERALYSSVLVASSKSR